MPLNFSSVPPDVLSLLKKLAGMQLIDNYILVGDTALSIYLNHLISNDIELLSVNGSLDSDHIYKQLTTVFDNIEIVKIENKKYHLRINSINLTFYSDKMQSIDKSTVLLDNLRIAGLELLTALAVSTFFLKSNYKDFYNLYVLNKDVFSLDEIYNIHRKYVNSTSLKLFQKELIWVFETENENISSMNPKYDLDIISIGKHFESEIISWNKRR